MDLKKREENLTGNWRKKNPCNVVTESLTPPLPALRGKVKDKPIYDLDDLATEFFCIKGTAWILGAYSKI